MCDAFNIPLVTFVDCPGYLPGIEQEHYGVIRHGAKVIYAYCQATVPEDLHRHAQGHGRRLYRHELQADAQRPGLRLAHGADRSDGRAGRRAHPAPQGAEQVRQTRPELEAQFIAEYRDKFFTPYVAADMGQIDEVIEPKETRPRLIRALEVLRTKVQHNPPKKHGIMPV